MFPIKVDPNSLTPAIITIVRNLIIMGLSAFGVTGIIADDDITKIASALVAIGLAVYGAYKAYKNNQKLATVEPYVPDSVLAKK